MNERDMTSLRKLFAWTFPNNSRQDIEQMCLNFLNDLHSHWKTTDEDADYDVRGELLQRAIKRESEINRLLMPQKTQKELPPNPL